MPNSLILQPGMSIGNGRYVLDRLLKQGRSSLTLQGTQVSNGRSLIFKFPLQDQGFLPAHRQRFQQIWQRVGHFQHPYLQQTVDYLEEQGIPCLVLEQISGSSLTQLVTHRPPLAEATALRLIFQIAQGVEQLHDRGLVHGDLKPQNLIQQTQGKAIVVVDWGLFWQGWNSQLSPYSAPEPFTAQELRPTLDVYSLAACLYTFVTGHPPIAAAQQLTTPLVPPQSLIPSLTPITQEAILQGMNLNPDRRPKSVQAWLTLLPQPYSEAQLPKVQAATPSPSLSTSPSASPSMPSPAKVVGANSSTNKTVQTQVAAPSPLAKANPSSSPHPRMTSFPTHTDSVNRGSFSPLLISFWVMTIAGGVGLAAGGFLRWQQPQNAFAPSFFEKSQSFPAKDWPGTLDLAFPEDAPLPETNSASDSYEPYLDWSPVTPTFPQGTATDSTDFFPSSQSDAPVALPGQDARDTSVDTAATSATSATSTEQSADPSEPLPNVNSSAFEDPLYAPPEETTPAADPPAVAPEDTSAAPPPSETSPETAPENE
jgi:serine/threonine protein kinase